MMTCRPSAKRCNGCSTVCGKKDNITLLRQWFKDGDPEETNEKIIDLAVNWLKDDDAPQKPGERIWGYFNP